MKDKIAVVGSCNTDMVMRTERLPGPGETVAGGEFFVFQGGKGANQAVAAARLGGDVVFIGKVGGDGFGEEAIRHYEAEGIDTRGIGKEAMVRTGVAVITVNGQGENSIVVAPGANALLSPTDLMTVLPLLDRCPWILTQLETPLAVLEFLSFYSKEQGKKLVLNPAPALALPAFVYKGLFLITPNESETAVLTGVDVAGGPDAGRAAAVFKEKGVRNVIITMGSRGVYADCENFCGMVPAVLVQAVDSTAAGDVFNGALLVALAEKKGWKEAIDFAGRAAAVSVTRMGAQASAPTLAELEAMTTIFQKHN